MWIILCIIFASSLVTYFLLNKTIPILKSTFIDHPSKRSSHNFSKPTAGGLFIIIPSLLITTIFQLINGFDIFGVIFLACIPISIVGLIDDKYSISTSIRFVIQISTSITLVILSNFYDFEIIHIVLILPFLIIFSTSIINFTNFMDGVDGLIGGSMIVILSAIFYHLSIPFYLWTLIGGLAGFLFLNWNPSKVFMGDIGSTFLGAFFAGMLLQSNTIDQAVSLFLISTPLMADSFFCVIRRFINGHNVLTPHRLHLYQRLNQVGWSHAKISLLYLIGCILIATVSFFDNLILLVSISLSEVMIGILLDKNVAKNFHDY